MISLLSLFGTQSASSPQVDPLAAARQVEVAPSTVSAPLQPVAERVSLSFHAERCTGETATVPTLLNRELADDGWPTEVVADHPDVAIRLDCEGQTLTISDALAGAVIARPVDGAQANGAGGDRYVALLVSEALRAHFAGWTARKAESAKAKSLRAAAVALLAKMEPAVSTPPASSPLPPASPEPSPAAAEPRQAAAPAAVDPFTARTLPPSKRIALAGGTDVRAYAVGRTTATGLQLGLDTGRWAYGLRHGYVESAEMRRSAHEVGLYATWYVKSYWFNEFNFRLGVGVTTTVLFHPAGSVLSMSSASHGEMGFPITRKVRATVGLETGATSAAGKAGQQSAFRGLFLGFTAASHFDL